MQKRTGILSVALLAMGLCAQAKVKLPHLLASKMVLQQQSDVKLWGEAKANAKLKVKTSWNNKTTMTRVGSDGHFELTVPTAVAGGPYTITFNDGEALTLDGVLLGEVWFCAGQSNMEMPMRGFDRQPLVGANRVIAKAKASTPIRMFVSDRKNNEWHRQASQKLQTEVYGEWLDNSPANVAQTSATAYYFAKYIQEVLEVPVGVIVSSRGGAAIETFMSKESLLPFGKDLSKVDTDAPVKNDCLDPCVNFNGKVNPFTKYNVKGFLWYQGESNRNNAQEYCQLMEAMVKDWRQRWGGGEQMPFYFVEIAPFDYNGPEKYGSALLREAQMKAWQRIPNSGLAALTDDGHHNFIHPVNKERVGERLAWWALGQTYGIQGLDYKTPVYRSMEVKDGKVYINADNVGNGMNPMWTSLKGFEIAGKDQVFYPAFAEIETSTCRLAVSSTKVPEPVAVRYNFHNWCEASVFNNPGLPLLPFRTDNWEVK